MTTHCGAKTRAGGRCQRNAMPTMDAATFTVPRPCQSLLKPCVQALCRSTLAQLLRLAATRTRGAGYCRWPPTRCYGASIVGKPRPGRLRGGTEPFSRHIWRRNAPRAGSPARAVTGHAPKRRTSVQLTGPSLKRYTKSVKLDFGSI